MVGQVLGRGREWAAMLEWLSEVAVRPVSLMVEGEAGIGKSTLWTEALREAQARGYRVVASRPVEAEAMLGYAGLADLLTDVDDGVLALLPVAQRTALEAALLRGPHRESPPDWRAVAVGFVSVVEALAAESPVVVAVDDLQWLDESSSQVLRFAVRRWSGPIGLLVSWRTTDAGPRPVLAPRDPAGARLLSVGPLTLAALHELVRHRTGRSLSRPTMVLLNRVAMGNPFYALEMAGAVGEARSPAGMAFPDSLRELVAARVERLERDVKELLLCVSALGAPTTAVVARVVGARNVARLVGRAEDVGIVDIVEGRVRFTHPLLSSAVYAGASPSQRRALHRRLADVVDGIEERARHLALGSVGPEPGVVAALCDAAKTARARGASAEAAEFLELAGRLGADDPRIRIDAALHHFDAGDPARADALLQTTVAGLPPGRLRAKALSLAGTIRWFNDDLAGSAQVLSQARLEAGDDRELRVGINLQLVNTLHNLGRIRDSLHLAVEAVADAEEQDDPGVLAPALAMLVVTQLLLGRGLDQATIDRALRLEDPERRIPTAFRPALLAALCFMGVGRFDEARTPFHRPHRAGPGTRSRGRSCPGVVLDRHARVLAGRSPQRPTGRR